MKLQPWKRWLAVLLALILCFSLLPIGALAANGPDPSPEGYPFVWLSDSEGRMVTLYPERTVDDALNDPGDAAVYDEASNTLTLNGFDGSEFSLEANTMGDDFTICALGTNTLRGIVVYGAMYGGSLHLTGNGSLTVNPDAANYCGIELDAEESDAVLTIGSELTLSVFGQNGTEPAVAVYDTCAAEGVVLPANAEGLQVERSLLQEKVTPIHDPDEYAPWFYLYAWEGGYYGATETYMSATHAFYYTMYVLTGDPENGFTAYAEIAEEKNLPAVPEKYEPVYGKFSNFVLTDASGDALGVVSILPSGEIGELIRPVLQIAAPDGTVGRAFTGQLTAAPANGGTIRYQIVTGPDWLTVDPITGALSGMPDKAGALPLIAAATETVRGQSVASTPAAKTLRIDTPVVTLRLAQALDDELERTLHLTQGSGTTDLPLGTGGLPAGVLYQTSLLETGECTAALTGTLHGVEHLYGAVTFTVPAGENLEVSLTDLTTPSLRHVVPTVTDSAGEPVENDLYRLEWYDGPDLATAQLIARTREYVCLTGEPVWVRAVPQSYALLQNAASPLTAVENDNPALTMATLARADVSGVVLLDGEDTPVRGARLTLSADGVTIRTGYTGIDGAFSLPDLPLLENAVITISADEIAPLAVPLIEAPEGPLEFKVQRRAGRVTLPYDVRPFSGRAETDDGAQQFALQIQSNAVCLADPDGVATGQTLRLHLYDGLYYTVGTVTLDEHLQGALEVTDRSYLGAVYLTPENPAGLACRAMLYSAEGKLLKATNLSFTGRATLNELQEGDYTVLYTAQRTYAILGEAALNTLEKATAALDAAGEDLYTTTTFHAAYSATYAEQQISGVLPTGSIAQNSEFAADACGLTLDADDATVTVRATLTPLVTYRNSLLLRLVTNQFSDANGRTPDLVNGSLYLNGRRVDGGDEGVTFYPSETDHAVNFAGTYQLKINDVRRFGGWPLTVQWQTYRTDFDRVNATLLASTKGQLSESEQSYIAYATVSTPVLRLVAPTLIAQETFNVYGYAPKGAAVTVFLDGAEAAQTTADEKNGFYKASLTLNDPYGARTYTVSAASVKGGQTVRSGETEVTYRSNAAYLTEISTFDYLNTKVPLWKDGAAYTGYYYYLPAVARPYELAFANCDGPDALEKVVVHVPRTDGEVQLEAHWVSGGTWRTDPYLAGNAPPNGAWVEYVPAWPGYELTANDFEALDRAVEADRADWEATVNEIKSFLGDDDATEFIPEETAPTPRRDGDANSAVTGLKIKWANGSTDLRELSFKLDGVRYTIRTDNVTNMTITHNKNKELRELFAQFEGKSEEERRSLPLFADAGDDVFYPFDGDDSYQRVGMQDGVLTCVAITRAGDKDLNTLWRVTTITPDRYTEEVYNTLNASVATLVYERETPFEIDLTDYYDPAFLVAEGEKQPWDNDVNRGLILQTLWFGAFYDMEAVANGEKTGTWAELSARSTRAPRPTLPNGAKISKNPGTAFYQLMAACLIQNGVERGAGQPSGRDAEVWVAFDVKRKSEGGGVYNNIKWKLGRELLGELKGTLDTSMSVSGNVTTLLTEGTQQAIYKYVKDKIEKTYYGNHVNPFNPTAKSKSAQKKIDEMGAVWDGVDEVFRELESRGYKIDRSLMPPDPRLTKEDYEKSQGKTDSNQLGGGGGGGGSGGGEEPASPEPGGDTGEPPQLPTNPPQPGAEQTPVPDSVKPAIDPSGYVYEGVPSNRVAGVSAVIYEVADDGATTLWDATEFGQINPYLTGENGFYEWMVPQGKWSVRFTADGYAPYVTGENDGVGNAKAGDTWYMPVAPAQLDVNINLRRLDAPQVVSAIPTAEGVRVTFSQYMRASALTADKFSVLINSLPAAPSEIRLLDGEENGTERCAREVLLVCAPEASDLVSLTVDAAVESYTGQPMTQPYILTDASVQTLPAAKAPQFTPNGGAAEIGSSVSIAAGSGSRIFYTTDGSEPTRESALYTGPIVIAGDVTLRAVAFETGKRDSEVTEASFTTKETYPITILTDGHGSVRSDRSRAAAGETVTLTVEPYGGYEPGSITLLPQGTKVIGSSFTMPESEVTLVVSFRDTVVPCAHDRTDTEHKDPTCTEPGYDIVICKDCGKVLSETEIAALGHDWEAPAYYWAEDYSTAKATRTCKNDPSHIESETVRSAGKVTKEATYEEEGEITYTAVFTNPAFETQILKVATPKLVKPVPENPFTDVKQGEYYYDPVLWAVNHVPQITNGTSATTFSPNDTCTRAQVVTFLWRANGCPEPETSSNPFTDVKNGEYYYKAVLWAVEKEITNGTSATTFSPNEGCTRAQVVTFLWRSEGKPSPTSTNNPFTDVRSGYYYDAVLWAVERKITNGTSDTAFSPDATCTRAQIVTFLYRDLAS